VTAGTREARRRFGVPQVETFTREMIEKCLKDKDLKFMIDQDGDIALQFGEDEDTGLSYSIFLRAGEDWVYTIAFLSDHEIPKANWGKAVMACNEWNRNYRWPKASVVMDEETSIGRAVLEGCIDLEDGVHQELLDEFTMIQIAGGMQFWRWITDEKKL
jgi:hypothetical protein